tara:strand:+ start:2864 stop:3490 length:627 start_codon:yes stop_codon:yes gene_type:complete
MENENLKPTREEVYSWLLGTVRHVQHIEYHLERLQIGNEDPERPHDIIGPGNKFEWDVIKGFAIQYRNRSQEFFDTYVEPSRICHHAQYHHGMWNYPNPKAPEDSMKLGSVDAVCSLLEPDRAYQGGQHTNTEISEIIGKNPEYKQPWLRMIHREMKKVEKLDLLVIRDLHDFPNASINPETYDTLRARVDETLKMLEERGYNLIGGN